MGIAVGFGPLFGAQPLSRVNNLEDLHDFLLDFINDNVDTSTNLNLREQGKWFLLGFGASAFCFSMLAVSWVLFCKKTSLQNCPVEMTETHFYEVGTEKSENSGILQTEI